MYRLYRYGRVMNYHGFRTRHYTTADLVRLLMVDISTVEAMQRRGVFDPPALVIRSDRNRPKNLWLYHQVQPVYLWYQHLRNRSVKGVVTKYRNEDMRKLKGAKGRMIALFHRTSGIPRPDPYSELAGRYGVIWKEDN